MRERRPVPCFLSPFPKCVICSLTCSGLHLAARTCCWPGRGGGVATRAGRASSTRNVVSRLGNRAGRSPLCLFDDFSRLLVVGGESPCSRLTVSLLSQGYPWESSGDLSCSASSKGV